MSDTGEVRISSVLYRDPYVLVILGIFGILGHFSAEITKSPWTKIRSRDFFLESFFIGPGHILYLDESPETHFRDPED